MGAFLTYLSRAMDMIGNEFEEHWKGCMIKYHTYDSCLANLAKIIIFLKKEV
jgi:hypothetical protein